MMRSNTVVTLYHFDEDTQRFAISFCGAALLYGSESISAGGKKGLHSEADFTLRIPGGQDLTVQCGDLVCNGTGDAVPDRALCRTVISFADNRRGANPHWRLSLR